MHRVTSTLVGLVLLAEVSIAAEYYTAPTGNDSVPCEQVTSTTPRQTINGGIACMAGGDTLTIAAGEYPELLVSGDGTQANVRKVQPNTYAIPSGTSAAPTTIKAQSGATVWLRPTVTYPGGGGVVTVASPAAYLHFEGLNLDGQDLHSQALYLKGNHAVYTKAEIIRGKNHCVTSQTDSHYVTFSHLHIHHCGLTSTMSPAPHAMYLCGTYKTVEHSYIHHAPSRAIQLSCEQGGITNGVIRFNRIEDVDYGIQLQGHDNVIHDNIIQRVGLGIWIGGGSRGLVNNNTIYDYRPVVSDTYGILAASSSGPVLRDNILMQLQEINSTTYNRYIHTTGSLPQMSGNMFDITPKGGPKPTFVATPEAVFVDAPGNDFHLKAGSPAIGVGYQSGNLGAAIPAPPEPPVEPPIEPPVEPPVTAGMTLDYQLNDGNWQVVEELTQKPSSVCIRVQGGTAPGWKICATGQNPPLQKMP